MWKRVNHDLIISIFSCEEEALEVQMSLCVFVVPVHSFPVKLSVHVHSISFVISLLEAEMKEFLGTLERWPAPLEYSPNQATKYIFWSRNTA